VRVKTITDLDGPLEKLLDCFGSNFIFTGQLLTAELGFGPSSQSLLVNKFG
jgi:hypothetical protein